MIELQGIGRTYRRPSGEDFELGVSVSSLATADPRNAGYLLVFQNLTDIKQLEREVRTKETSGPRTVCGVRR